MTSLAHVDADNGLLVDFIMPSEFFCGKRGGGGGVMTEDAFSQDIL